MNESEWKGNISIYNILEDIHWWRKYYPYDVQHLKYETNIIFAAHKISDLYYACCSARAFLHYMNNRDFGDFAKDDISKLYVITLLLQNSLIYYNIAVDFSWQVLWLYYNIDLIGHLPTNALYQESLRECNYEALLLRLTLSKNIKMRDEIVRKYFDKSSIYQKIREKYNYLKHRGTFHFQGLGMNYDSLFCSIHGKRIPLICRKELDVQCTRKLLLEFDKEFIQYCNLIIHLLMPKDFTQGSVGFDGIAKFYLKYKDKIDELPI